MSRNDPDQHPDDPSNFPDVLYPNGHHGHNVNFLVQAESNP